MDDTSKLQERIAYLEQQNRNLQESIGRWRRKAQGSATRFVYASERHERGNHYISVPIEGLPADTPLHEAQVFMRNNVLPRFYPYKYWNCYSSKRYGGWVVTLVKEDRTIDMDSSIVGLN
ncbi:hypothetical protein [Paenibacillus oryzisoli]|uniref:Uncharacterized protein n=1 Tax=Paenibacillus oryzisoli TaxID=1850517 RepID=A0A197ZWY7_9BACL|nr:hypothetical protein [Paenibacillus oryzisoli]OAS13238.1 hypothetical protein A8708_33175 [Paenibacillus oryzisoli]